MGVSSGCHFILKWQPDGGAIRLSFYFEMTTGWHTHPFVIFFWNVNRMEVPSGSYFFSCINRIGLVVELKFYIRVQEEFVLRYFLGYFQGLKPTSPFLIWASKRTINLSFWLRFWDIGLIGIINSILFFYCYLT